MEGMGLVGSHVEESNNVGVLETKPESVKRGEGSKLALAGWQEGGKGGEGACLTGRRRD